MPREADVPYFNYRSGGGEEWREHTACGPIGTKHPWTAFGPGSAAAIKLGLEICNGICPVRRQCLAYALTAGIQHGTWGGVPEAKRARMSEQARRKTIATGRMTRYAEPQTHSYREYSMVVVIAKTKFVPHLSPGEVGEVEDPLARAAVRNGYAALVGDVLNFDDWMYHGADLVLGGRTAQGNEKARAANKARAKKPQTDMVESPVSLVEDPA